MLTTHLHAAKRVTDNPPYTFATLSKRLQAMAAEGTDIIRLDIGNPDMPPPDHIIDSLAESSRAANVHGYPGYFGTPQLRGAMADYYQRRYGVTLDPKTEIIPLIGSKEGIANMHLAWLDPGDVALVPDPGYFAYDTGPKLVGGVVETFPLTAENNWLPDFSAIPQATAEKARLIWLNYPNNPTGAVADLDFFAEAIDFCRRYEILLCHDNPYSDVTFDGFQAVSPLEIPGAKDVVIEFNSLSKTYNMAGWRVGMAVGNPVAVDALISIKTQIDSGFALPVQEMAVTALSSDQSWLADRNHTYQRRRDMIVEALAEMDIVIPSPKATFYIWFPVPSGYTDVTFCEKLLQEAHVSVAAGSAYGEQGRNWIRLSVGTPTDRLEEALARIRRLKW